MPVLSPHWRFTAFPLARSARAWLFRPGALTMALRALGDFSLEPLGESPQPLSVDEARALGMRPGGLGWVREVLMRVDGVPCVAARSVTPLAASRGAWRSLRGRGARPLGESLYRDRKIHRQRFQWCCPAGRGPLGALIARSAAPGGTALARRSRFMRQGSALLVSECFLPDFWARFAAQAAPLRLTPRWSLAERRIVGRRRSA